MHLVSFFSVRPVSIGLGVIRFVAITLALCGPLCAEMPRPVSPQAYLPPRVAVQSAGMIFSGTVLKVAHLRPAGFPGITQITFRVENAIRGTRSGQTVTVREWAGLWGAGERYRLGERVLLFLYPRSKLGLTSPVGGASGRYEVDHAGQVLVGGVGPRPQPIHIQEFAARLRRAAQEQEQ